jgi:hypothetical protein
MPGGILVATSGKFPTSGPVVTLEELIAGAFAFLERFRIDLPDDLADG